MRNYEVDLRHFEFRRPRPTISFSFRISSKIDLGHFGQKHSDMSVIQNESQRKGFAIEFIIKGEAEAGEMRCRIVKTNEEEIRVTKTCRANMN